MVGSRTSGSSARPMRSVLCACAPDTSASVRVAAANATRKIFITAISISIIIDLNHPRLQSALPACTNRTNPVRGRTFLAAAERREQFLERRRQAVVKGDDGNQRQLRRAVAGGGVAV